MISDFNQEFLEIVETVEKRLQSRQTILDVIIDKKALSVDRIISYLQYFIRRSIDQPKMKRANEKWSKDSFYIHSKYAKVTKSKK